MLAFHLIFVLYIGYVLLKMSIFVQNLKVHAKNTHIYTYNHHGNEPLLAAILASGKYIWACLPSVIVPVYLEFTALNK